MKLLRLPLFLILLAQLSGCAPLLVGGAAASGILVAQDRRTAGTMLNDQRIEVRVRDFIVKDKELLEQSQVKVTSYNGIVLLTGEVTRADLAEQLVTFTKQEAHVREVRNELQVAALRDAAARRADTALTSRVRNRLFSAPEVKSNTLQIVAYDGTVYMLGLITRAEAEQAVEATRTVPGVRRIVRIFEYVKPE